MASRIKRALPAVAVVAALAALGLLVFGSVQRQSMLTDTGATLGPVEDALAPLLAQHPASAGDPALRQAAEVAAQGQYVATLWLFAPDGRIVYAAGSTAASAASGTAADHATDETRRVLAALPPDALSAEQRTELLVASAIQAEGEHNDVYRHLVRPVRGAGGEVVALVGVAYDASPAVGAAPGAAWVLSMAGLLLAAGAYWLALPLWTWLDARERGERAWAWAAFVGVGNLVALLAYILARD